MKKKFKNYNSKFTSNKENVNASNAGGEEMKRSKCHARNSSLVKATEGSFDIRGEIWTNRNFSFPGRCINIATCFSGIGAPETALERLGLKTKQIFACDMGERYLKEKYKTHREFTSELSQEEKEKYVQALYEDNQRSINEKRKAKAQKTGKFDFLPLTCDEVRQNLFGSTFDKGQTLEMGENCINLLIKHRGLTTNEEKETFVRELYARRGINYIKESFFANHSIEEKDWYTDIRFLDATKYKGQVDLYVGGSPCQSYSISGKRLGLNDTRGTLFYQFARIIRECRPKVFIYENVPGMMTCGKEQISGLEYAVDIFKNELGYDIHWMVLNASDYGVPQNRERIWVIGFEEKTDFLFPSPIPLTACIEDYLDPDTFDENGNVRDKNGEVSDFILRKLSGMEALRLMGFNSFIVPDILKNHKISDTKRESILMSHAGNSMVVECLMALYRQMDITKYGR